MSLSTYNLAEIGERKNGEAWQAERQRTKGEGKGRGSKRMRGDKKWKGEKES